MNKIKIVLLITVVLLSFYNCTEKSNHKTNSKTILSTESFDWLLGKWQRVNEENGKETFEIWKKITDKEYSGIGFTLQKNDTVKQKRMKIVKLNEKWILKVQPQNELTPTIFNITSFNENQFICENKEIDFPKLIKYWKNGDKINALVAGDSLKIKFEFERLSK